MSDDLYLEDLIGSPECLKLMEQAWFPNRNPLAEARAGMAMNKSLAIGVAGVLVKHFDTKVDEAKFKEIFDTVGIAICLMNGALHPKPLPVGKETDAG